MESENDQQEVLNPDENQDSNPETESDDTETKLKKAEEIAKNQKIRAEKAEQELKALKKTQQEKPVEKETPKNEPKNEGLSVKDIIALRDVHEEDVDYLLEESKLRGKSVSELKKDPYIKIILQTREEERKTALAANTAQANRGTSAVSDEALLEDFDRGIVPEKPEDIQRLTEAQLKRRKALAKAA